MTGAATARTGPLVVVGDALLDRDLDGTAERLAPDAPVPVVADPVERTRPGGAALAALLAAADAGSPVVLVTALGADPAGAEVRRLLEVAGVEVVDLGLRGATGEKVRVRAAGTSVVRLDYGGTGAPCGPLPAAVAARLRSAAAVLVSCYGRGVTAEPSVRHALADVAPAVPVVWDPHPRGPAPVAGTRLATPNRAEAERFAADLSCAPESASALATVAAQARALARKWDAANVAVTLGDGGALLVGGDGTPLAIATTAAAAGDPCGAGDRFASRAAALLAAGALPSEAVAGAVAAATAFVAAGGAATWPHPGAQEPVASGVHDPKRSADSVIAATRARGGTVVATGGCFDLLHAGHIRALEAARALGDCLVVCLNSDDSVRRLKGPSRPLVPVADRAAVLRGLASVDAVEVFSEDTPEAVLDRLRPDIWAKGADYAVADLPEARLLETWGGQAVVVPFLPGRSTTTLLEQAARRRLTASVEGNAP